MALLMALVAIDLFASLDPKRKNFAEKNYSKWREYFFSTWIDAFDRKVLAFDEFFDDFESADSFWFVFLFDLFFEKTKNHKTTATRDACIK